MPRAQRFHAETSDATTCPSRQREREMRLQLVAIVALLGALVPVHGSRLQSPRLRPDACLRLRGGARVESTYAMLKPDVAGKKDVVEEVERMITAAGLTIERKERCRLSKELCQEFYGEHSERPFFKDLVEFVSKSPVIKMELSGPDAIKTWRKLLGPTNTAKAKDEAPDSIRAKFGTDGMRNAAHGSDSPDSAAREIKLMFKGGGFPKM